MKKTLLLLAAVAALVGCKKDPDDPIDDPKNDPKVAKMEVVMNVEKIEGDVLDYFTFTYKYTDFAGNEQSKEITAPGQTAFSIENPEMKGEELCNPFTVELAVVEKGTAAKASGNYSGAIKWELDLNGYYKDGSLITDSGYMRKYDVSANLPNDNFDDFKRMATGGGIDRSTYGTFFCKTFSGEWHIGFEKQK